MEKHTKLNKFSNFFSFYRKLAKGDRHWTVTECNLAVDLVKQGKTYHKVEKETGIPNCTVSRTMGRFKKCNKKLFPLIVISYLSFSIDCNIILQIKKD